MEQKLVAPDAGASDEFGYKVTLIPGWALCSAPDDDDGQSQSGAVYVYEDTPPGWVFHQKLKMPAPVFGAGLGKSLSAWGDWLVAGTPTYDPQGYFGRGAVQVFNLQGDSWVHTQEVLASDFTSSSQQYFGEAVRLRGERMVVGESNDNKQGFSSGSAYVFELSGTTWIEVAKIYASDWESGASFGRSVAINGDTIVVGASAEDNGALGSNQGAAYVFERNGSTWVETQKLVASDPKNGDAFGSDVAVEGDTILVGAGAHDHVVSNDGAMYVFERQGGTWVQTQELLASDPWDSPRLGNTIGLDGDMAVASAHGDDDVANDVGSAYVFRRNASGSWLQIGKALNPAAQPSTLFGHVVALRGSRILVGAPSDDTACPSNPGCNSGSAFLHELAPAAEQYGGCGWPGPCNNHDDFGGCLNSTSHGGVLSAAGSASVAADELRFEARWLPANKLGIFFMGGATTNLFFADGQLCVASGGMGIWRFNPPQSSGAEGVLNLGPGVAGLSQLLPPGGHVFPGQTWHFQAWFRDPTGPCGLGSNMTNAVRVTFEP
jgi:hypothetical protein